MEIVYVTALIFGVLGVVIGFVAGIVFAELNWKHEQKLVDMRRDAEDMERRTRIVRAMGEHRRAVDAIARTSQ